MTHWYDEDGILLPEGQGYPSVTTILDICNEPELTAWKVRVAANEGLQAILDTQKAAQDRGTAVHSYIEAYVKGEDFLIDPDYELHFEGFRTWYEKFQPKIVDSEKFLISRLYGYAGRSDLICMIDGEYWLIDFKCTNKVKPRHGLQLTAYAQAYYDMTGNECKTAVLQLTDTIKRGYRWRQFNEDFEVFLAHKRIFDWRELGKQRKSASSWDGRSLFIPSKELLGEA